MRIVGWNCQGGLKKKWAALLRLEPDIAVISEAAPKALMELPAGAGMAMWAGDATKCVAIVPFNSWQLEPCGVEITETYFVPAIATKGDRSINLVGVWVKSANSYVEPTLRALSSLSAFMRTENTIVIGDFNQSVNFDKGRSAGRRFQDVLEVFRTFEMRSAWHHHRDERHGSESVPTHRFRRHSHEPFHIDYAFVPSRLNVKQIEIDDFDQGVMSGLSDHAPIILDLEVPQMLKLSA